ncbi:MAG TPA: hypothetical protein VL688_06740 [Verrucomicrobiae bacterium]|nr:hypothetical protein [Verrucomicrobiae bacterium]
MQRRTLLSFFAAVLFFAPCAAAQDCWLAPKPVGRADGADAANAMGARNAQHCWDQTSADGTLHVLEGDYTPDNGAFWKLSIDAAHDGPDGTGFKTLQGEGHVKIVGSRPVPYKPADKDRGESWITIKKGARGVRIRNFEVSRVKSGIQSEGENHDLELENLSFADTRQNIFLTGSPSCKSLAHCGPEEKLSSRITIRGVNGLRYSKRHVRLGRGVFQVKVLDSHADGGDLDQDFAVGFDVEGPAWDVAFEDCTSRHNRYTLTEYWNGDGFKSELETKDIRFARCSAFDNADGGFDLKSEDAVLTDSVALRNSRNIRIWRSARLENVNASYSRAEGGNSSEAGLWSSGRVECTFCTFHNNGIQVHAEKSEGTESEVRLVDSIVSLDKSRKAPASTKTSEPPEMLRREEGAVIETVRTAEYQEGVKGKKPEFGHASEAWEGKTGDFNSRAYGTTKGYYYPRAS